MFVQSDNTGFEQGLGSVKEVVLATGSEKRKTAITSFFNSIVSLFTQEIQINNISPDERIGIEESDDNNPGWVAFLKALLLGYAIGLVKEDEIDSEILKNWHDRGVTKINPEDENIDIGGGVLVYGGDVITSIKIAEIKPEDNKSMAELRNLLRVENFVKFLKLDRDLVNLVKDCPERQACIDRDKAQVKNLYTHPNGFWVLYKLGIGMLLNDDNGHNKAAIGEWEGLLKFKPLPEDMIEAAYKEEVWECTCSDQKNCQCGKAFQVGPRIDLVGLANDYRDRRFSVLIRPAGSEEWQTTELTVLQDLVWRGILPPHMFLHFLIEMDESDFLPNNQPITKEKFKLNFS